MFALIQDGSIVRYPYTLTDLRLANPHISFATVPDDETLESHGLVQVGFSSQPVASYQQVVEEGLPVFNQELNLWQQVWTVRDLTPEELQQRTDSQAQNVREERNLKLSQSDWTQLADSPVDKELWAAYRQALRDVPSQVSFPWDVTWPTQPE
jgi:hypothetical protein